jgi:hypothetical protein
MKDRWGPVFDLVMPLIYLFAIVCAILLIFTVSILTLIIRPIKLFFKGIAFITGKSWNWIRSPLSDQG